MPLAEHDMFRLRLETAGSQFQFTCPSRSTTRGERGAVQRGEFQFTCPSRSTTARASGTTAAHVSFQFTCPSRSTTPTKSAVTPPA